MRISVPLTRWLRVGSAIVSSRSAEAGGDNAGPSPPGARERSPRASGGRGIENGLRGLLGRDRGEGSGAPSRVAALIQLADIAALELATRFGASVTRDSSFGRSSPTEEGHRHCRQPHVACCTGHFLPEHLRRKSPRRDRRRHDPGPPTTPSHGTTAGAWSADTRLLLWDWPRLLTNFVAYRDYARANASGESMARATNVNANAAVLTPPTCRSCIARRRFRRRHGSASPRASVLQRSVTGEREARTRSDAGGKDEGRLDLRSFRFGGSW